jgi:hypothetical protein
MIDENHILFPSLIDDGLYVYDIRTMPPINTRKQKLKGTHCFEMTISRFWDNEAVCSITLDCNSLTTCSDAAAGHFYAIPYDRIVSLRNAAELNPTGGNANWGQDYFEMHVRV